MGSLSTNTKSLLQTEITTSQESTIKKEDNDNEILESRKKKLPARLPERILKRKEIILNDAVDKIRIKYGNKDLNRDKAIELAASSIFSNLDCRKISCT